MVNSWPWHLRAKSSLASPTGHYGARVTGLGNCLDCHHHCEQGIVAAFPTRLTSRDGRARRIGSNASVMSAHTAVKVISIVTIQAADLPTAVALAVVSVRRCAWPGIRLAPGLRHVTAT
jgi:hypothetical protein